MSELSSQCQALREGIGYRDLTGRTQIELVGADRVKLLHGLCTNDIKRLVPGDGCEAFLTNVQGKTIGYVHVYCTAESLFLDTSPGLAGEIVPAIDRFIIREDAMLIDRSDQWGEVLVSGVRGTSLLESQFDGPLPAQRLGISAGTIHGTELQLRRFPYTSPECFLICCETQHVAEITAWLAEAGGIECGQEAVDAARIEMGVPVYGQDVTAENLPQELARDEFAISFTKGCYLGQETVARIDALGHVNRRLTGLRFSSETIPPAGTAIEIEGKQVGRVTSSCYSTRLDAALALAFVRRGSDKPGTVVSSPFGNAEVVALPLP